MRSRVPIAPSAGWNPSGRPCEILQGDVRQILKNVPDDTFHGLVSDPPYGLSFMGKRWDYDVPTVGTWAEVLRVLRPGAYGVIFGGSRTFHRLACSVEDAGFEIRDVVMWLYGSGFPKSLDASKAIDARLGKKDSRKVVGSSRGTSSVDGGSYRGGVGTKQRGVDVPITAPATTTAAAWDGYGTALKPAYEPALVVCKPSGETVSDTCMRWGTGAVAIDVCRVGEVGGPAHPGDHSASKSMFGMGTAQVVELGKGRWPANVVVDASVAALLDEFGGQPSRRPSFMGRGLRSIRTGPPSSPRGPATPTRPSSRSNSSGTWRL
jgi:site-specific DNA-methyltransferase (adenine-specific)